MIIYIIIANKLLSALEIVTVHKGRKKEDWKFDYIKIQDTSLLASCEVINPFVSSFDSNRLHASFRQCIHNHNFVSRWNQEQMNFRVNNLWGTVPTGLCDLRNGGTLTELEVDETVDCDCCT